MVALGNPFVALGAVATGVGVVLAIVVWHQRDAPGARAYTVLLLVLSTWSALYVGQLLAGPVGAKRPWLVVRHAISPLVPISFWTFAAMYTDRDWLLSRRYLGPILGTGAVLAAMPVLDPGNAYWRDLSVDALGTLSVLDVTFGPLFWCMLAYIVVVVAVGHGLVVATLVDSFAIYRRQLAAVAVSGVVGFGLLAVFLTGHVPWVPTVNPFPHVQLLSYATVLVALPLGWSYYRDALFGVQPLAHRTVIGNMDDAVVVLDTDGIVRKTNAPARRLVGGADARELAGTNVETVFADRPSLLQRYRDLVATEPTPGDATGGGSAVPTASGRTADQTDGAAAKLPDAAATGTAVDPVAVRVDGQQRHVDLRASAIENATGAVIGTVLVIRDVTTEATQRERLRRKNEQLERLADVVSHDLQAPLSTADKLTTLLAADLDDPDPAVERTLSDLEDVHGRLRGFAEDIPRLARESVDVETGEPCDLETLARRAWSLVDTGDLELRIEDTRTISGDPRRLQRLFQNLFENAAEHATAPTDGGAARPAGEAEASRSTGDAGASGQAEDAEDVGGRGRTGVGATVRVGPLTDGFYVADDGPGIPPERRDAVLEYGTGEGTGFGLAIVRSVVEAHGWSLDVTESDAGGARFEVRERA